MVQSVRAVLIGILLALFIGALVVLGIVAPVFTRFFGPELAATALVPAVFVGFAAAFAFYWGGMYASYKAPNRRRLHGVLVGVMPFGAYLLTANDNVLFTNLNTSVALLLIGVLFVVVLAASYVGARRGETLYAHNQAYREQEQRRKSREERSKTNKPGYPG